MLGAAPGSADTPRAHITNMAALGIEYWAVIVSKKKFQLTSVQNAYET
jgi:hypothetical protein